MALRDDHKAVGIPSPPKTTPPLRLQSLEHRPRTLALGMSSFRAQRGIPTLRGVPIGRRHLSNLPAAYSHKPLIGGRPEVLKAPGKTPKTSCVNRSTPGRL